MNPNCPFGFSHHDRSLLPVSGNFNRRDFGLVEKAGCGKNVGCGHFWLSTMDDFLDLLDDQFCFDHEEFPVEGEQRDHICIRRTLQLSLRHG